MSFNLLLNPWIPVRRASGTRHIICPSEITAGIEADPIVALDWPRPDFRLACLEFLIGLLATACPPENDDGAGDPGDWIEWWRAPPTPDTLAAAFAPFAHAFVLDGDGPRFMQDFEDFGGEANRIETLLINAPGGQTLKKNTDHFIKRDSAITLGRAAAAMALFTLQSFAPAGGAGNRVGLRGGGPLTTLALPPATAGRPLPLWHLVWANVPVGDVPTPADLPKVFPWLAATRTSEGARTTTPERDAHPLQAFWGMARRIRLEFADNTGAVPCDLGSAADSVVATGWRQRPYGANYANWQHPLSPYYRQKANGEKLPVHAQPGGIGYRHWVGMLFTDVGVLREPAACIKAFRDRRLHQIAPGRARQHWRLLAAGYDMDNMKARGFVESEMPVVEPGDRARSQPFAEALRLMIDGASDVASLLGRSVRRALFSDGAKVALDASLFATLRERFWEATEGPFLRHVQTAADGATDPEALRRQWLGDLARVARALFDEAAPIDANGADRHPERIAAAAKSLDLALRGMGKDGAALFAALGLPSPEAKPKSKPPKPAATTRSKSA